MFEALAVSWLKVATVKAVSERMKISWDEAWSILDAVMLKVTNAIAESISPTIQKIKARACGFRNRARFRTAVLFYKGGLSLPPWGISGS